MSYCGLVAALQQSAEQAIPAAAVEAAQCASADDADRGGAPGACGTIRCCVRCTKGRGRSARRRGGHRRGAQAGGYLLAVDKSGKPFQVARRRQYPGSELTNGKGRFPVCAARRAVPVAQRSSPSRVRYAAAERRRALDDCGPLCRQRGRDGRLRRESGTATPTELRARRFTNTNGIQRIACQSSRSRDCRRRAWPGVRP